MDYERAFSGYPKARAGVWNLAFGFWLIAFSLIAGFRGNEAWSHLLTGAALVGMAWKRRNPSRTGTGLNVLLGLWLLAGPLLLRFENAVAGWNSFAVGLLVILIIGTAKSPFSGKSEPRTDAEKRREQKRTSYAR